MKICCPVLLGAGLAVAPFSALTSQEAKVDFAKEIQPILLKNCVECHGPEKQKGKLRLDLKAEAFKEATVVVAGKAQESELYRRITLPADSDDRMPPQGERLSQAQTDVIRDWINQGALWPDNLALMSAPPSETAPPKDPRPPIQPSAEEQQAIAQLQALGAQVRPVAMNVTWTVANFRGIDTNQLDQAMLLVSRIPTLEELNLAGLPIKDDQLQHLSSLTNLIRLHLEKTAITDAGLAHLKNLPHLQYLNLYQTAVSDAGLPSLAGLKSLKKLFLWQTQVTTDGAEQMRAALPGVDVNRGWETKPAAAEETAPEKKEQPADAEKKAG